VLGSKLVRCLPFISLFVSELSVSKSRGSRTVCRVACLGKTRYVCLSDVGRGV